MAHVASDQLEFVNTTGRMIMLVGPPPKLEKVQLVKSQSKILPRYFERYVPRYLRVADKSDVVTKQKPNKILEVKRRRDKVLEESKRRREYLSKIKQRVNASLSKTGRTMLVKKLGVASSKRPIVGSSGMRKKESQEYFDNLMKKVNITISNDIGIGILSYNRLSSLNRLLISIRRYTNLKNIKVIISDESDDNKIKNYLSNLTDVIVLQNSVRLGVAGNTNRLMRCLERFKYKIILNDDVEVMMAGWENLYVRAMVDTRIHHFCMRQPGVYGAKHHDGSNKIYDGINVQTITSKPQGAVFVYDHVAFDKVGYFDESFGFYGMEHVDWSTRVSNSGIQPPGYHDVVGSEKYFKIHDDKSSVEQRGMHLRDARKKFDMYKNNKDRIYINATERSDVKGVSFIVPFQLREQNRGKAISVVLQNIKGQHFPYIEIIIVEQDCKKRYDFEGLKHYLVRGESDTQPFTKSIAFNYGVLKASNDKIILHDADMIIQDDYTSIINDLLDKYDGVHIGRTVLYLADSATKHIIKRLRLDPGLEIERSVRYFEGGSLACNRSTFKEIGGFCEDFVGYGNEDTEFFTRLSRGTNFYNNREVDLIHLWHERSGGWDACHNLNKNVERKLSAQPLSKRIVKMRAAFESKYKKV